MSLKLLLSCCCLLLSLRLPSSLFLLLFLSFISHILFDVIHIYCCLLFPLFILCFLVRLLAFLIAFFVFRWGCGPIHHPRNLQQGGLLDQILICTSDNLKRQKKKHLSAFFRDLQDCHTFAPLEIEDIAKWLFRQTFAYSYSNFNKNRYCSTMFIEFGTDSILMNFLGIAR